ncbi:helix-turn-helix domain-containing protein [Xanthovirga aplysinae]|uniref:helix-turn-helix domain-containing protein n=1 Tax=Xanthovirga aplysinae TaxID=2529853 RepID=UPI0012BBC7D7|nr:helix-turn-helix domain-containing protein [Xanthovirga aplysinae]MTI30726.1 AraC family transcriptional regulator [Xanthovirga aplysinae]
MEDLNSLLKKEKLFLNSELTLTTLSDRMGITSKQLSQVINQVQQENYSQYITRYRIGEAKRMLSSWEYEHYKIAAIAFESGFNSLSSFNAAFKKHTNTTAVKFRQMLLE